MKFMALPEPEPPKLVMMGWRFYGYMTGRFNPENWPKFSGNSRQRRIKRRYMNRMWKEVGQWLKHPPQHEKPADMSFNFPRVWA